MHRISLTSVLLLGLICAAPALGIAQAPLEPKEAELAEKFELRLQELAEQLDGIAGVGVKDLSTGQEFYINPDVVFPQASAIKIAILLKLYAEAQAGRINLAERYTVPAADFTRGSGVLKEFGDASVTLSWRDLAVLMIIVSDNTATNVLIDRLSMAGVNDILAGFGFARLRLNRKMGEYIGPKAMHDSTATPREWVNLLTRLQRGELLDPEHTRDLLDILKKPKRSRLRDAIPARVLVANKTGSLPGVRCDTGIVYLEGRPYILTISTTYLKDDEDGGDFIEDASRLAYDYFARLAGSNPYGRRLR